MSKSSSLSPMLLLSNVKSDVNDGGAEQDSNLHPFVLNDNPHSSARQGEG